jgi:hypothetical protein
MEVKAVRKHDATLLITLVTLILLVGMSPACYTGGRIEVRAVPPEAYVYIDGTPVADGTASGDNNIIVDDLKPGEYTVGIYNYGYKPEERKVTVNEGKTAHIDVDLVREVGPISGPWGRIIMEGPPHAAVFLNGDAPGFLVGHVDEFDKDLGGWRGQLIVPPGTYKMTVKNQSADVWSGQVTVAANQTVNVDVKAGGKQSTSDWKEGGKVSSLWPLKASVFRSTVAVAPVTAKISADPATIGCGGTAKLTWSSAGGVTGQISELGDVPASGDRDVQPKQTTDYKLTAAGPGGIATPDATVTVNPAIQATLNLSPTEVRYHKTGDKVDQQGSATLTWSTTGADSVSLDPGGTVQPSGDQTVQAAPSNAGIGPVDQTVTYTLRATNVCGGTETRTASLHIVGAIESGKVEPNFDKVNSIYFLTAEPTRHHPEGGLVPSEESELGNLLAFVKQYLDWKPDAHLLLEGHADVRGGNKYNDALTERRNDRIKNYLVNQSVPAANIDTKADGKRVELSRKEVLQLNDQNPNLSPQERKKIRRNIQMYWLANNRRVDIKLPSGRESNHYFPYSAPDAKELAARGRHHEGRRSAKKKQAPASQ